MKIGQQLFSLRSLCDTPENLDKCLELVHNMGYSCVQLSGICEACLDTGIECLRRAR